MCGRFVVARATADLVSAFSVDEVVGDDLPPSWNVAPTQKVRIVTGRGEDGEPSRRLETARWGLVPVWAKSRSVGSRAINARSETVLEKPMFRSAAVKRRALVPADRYYEWQVTAGGKRPTYLHPEDDGLLGFAGLYEFWHDPEVLEGEDGERLMTTTILTRPAEDALGHIHDRMPVIVPTGELQGDWLDPALTDKSEIRSLLDAIPDPKLVPREVGKDVGNVRNNSRELIEGGVVGEVYVPPPGEYVRPAGVYRIKDPRHKLDRFDTHFVRGAIYHKAAFERLRTGQELVVELVPEPGNPHDSDAVALHTTGLRIGYIGADYAENWHDAVSRINRMGMAVIASGVVHDAGIPEAAVFLPWLNWSLRDEPTYLEECEALVSSLAPNERDQIIGVNPNRLGDSAVNILRRYAAFAPSLDWGALEICRGMPLQLFCYLKDLRVRVQEAEWEAYVAEVKQQQVDAFRMRTDDQMTFVAIAAQLGCSPSTASKRYREYLAGLSVAQQATVEADRIAFEDDLKNMILEEYGRDLSLRDIAKNVGCPLSRVRQVLAEAGRVRVIDHQSGVRAQRVDRCREACERQASGASRRQIAAAMGTSTDIVKSLLRDGKFYAEPYSDMNRLSRVWRSRAPELEGLGLDAAAILAGTSVAKLKEARRDHSVIRGLYGETVPNVQQMPLDDSAPHVYESM